MMKTRRFWFVAIICLVVASLSFSAPQESKFKNIQVMKGMSAADINRAMAGFARQLGVQCSTCHVQGDFASDEKPEKLTARMMYGIVQTLNEQDFFKNGTRKADCYLCHKGSIHIEPAGF